MLLLPTNKPDRTGFKIRNYDPNSRNWYFLCQTTLKLWGDKPNFGYLGPGTHFCRQSHDLIRYLSHSYGVNKVAVCITNWASKGTHPSSPTLIAVGLKHKILLINHKFQRKIRVDRKLFMWWIMEENLFWIFIKRLLLYSNFIFLETCRMISFSIMPQEWLTHLTFGVLNNYWELVDTGGRMYREAGEVKTGLDMKQHRGRREVQGQVAKKTTLFLFNK